jgi:citrate synthase
LINDQYGSMERHPRLSSAEAAARLGVKPATLYAYVSRGLLRSRRDGPGRGSSFDLAEVERLARRGRGRRGGPDGATEIAIASRLTAIEDGRLRYRGLDAVELSATRSFEEVASWLWTGDFAAAGGHAWRADPAAVRVATRAQAALPRRTLPLERLQVIAAALAAADELRFELHPEAAVTTAEALIAGLVEALPAAGGGDAPAAGERIAGRLWRRLAAGPPEAGMGQALEAALVLVADHELAASTLAARIAASVRANPYAVVAAALGVVSGALHGGASLGAEALLAEVGRPADAASVIGERLRRGERLPGFGHFVYAGEDPRAVALLALVRQAAAGTTAGSARLQAVEAVLDAGRQRRLPAANVDFALAALTHLGGMVRGAAEAIFAVGRVAGWLAHAFEEYQRATPIRLRATYTGPAAG